MPSFYVTCPRSHDARAAQTFNNPLRERGVATVPPPVVSFQATVSQWEIYDSYMQEFVSSQKQEAAATAKSNDRKKGAGAWS